MGDLMDGIFGIKMKDYVSFCGRSWSVDYLVLTVILLCIVHYFQ